jgi:pimeloyl-ACP methyl ester carboxylesterase
VTRRSPLLPALALLAASLAGCSSRPACGMEKHVFVRTCACPSTCSARERAYDCYVALPEGYDDPARREERWPLLLYLPGMMSYGRDVSRPVRGGPPQEIGEGRKIPMVVLMPTTPTYLERWTPDLVAALIDHAIATWRIDPDRVVVSGVSIGAWGAWDVAQAHPERVAAIVPVAGWGSPWGIARMKDVAVWAFHGGIDFAVPPPLHTRLVRAHCCAGGDPRLTLVPWGFHWIWDEVYARDDLYEWMLAQRRRRPRAARAPHRGAGRAGTGTSRPRQRTLRRTYVVHSERRKSSAVAITCTG